MNPEVKSLWIDALLSGKYKKGEGKLFWRRPDGTECHCALGVLAEEAGKAGLIELDKSTGNQRERYGYIPPDHLVPSEVIQWAGFGTFKDEQALVMRENDAHRRYRRTTFKDVASFIEERF